MKKLIINLLALMLLFCSSNAFADDYETLYENAQPFGTQLYNDIDPFEDQDSLTYAWSPYPLFRTSTYLYFKDFTIEPGYYILTPRTLKGNDYVLFKQGGKVKFIIPVAKKEKTPVNFYDANIPKVKKTKWQKFTSGVKEKFYNVAKDSMRKTPPKSVVNVDIEVTYIILTLYYGEDKYTVLFKRSPY